MNKNGSHFYLLPLHALPPPLPISLLPSLLGARHGRGKTKLPPWGRLCARGRTLLSRMHALRRALLPQRLAHLPQARRASSVPIRDSIAASISACHAEDPGSIPGCGVMHRCALETTHSPREARKKRIGALTSFAHCPRDLPGAPDFNSPPSSFGRAQGP